MDNENVEYGKYKNKTFMWVATYDNVFFKQIPNLYFKNYSAKKKQSYKKAVLFSGDVSDDKIIELKSDKVIGWIKDKVPQGKIKQNLIDEGLLDYKAIQSIRVAKKHIQKEYEEERNILVDLHCLRYEEMYFTNMEVDLSHIPTMFRKNAMAEHYLMAMETLSSKEKVLGMHSKDFKVKMNNFYVSQKTKSEPGYDLSKLNLGDLIEFLDLIEKGKKVEEINKPQGSRAMEDDVVEETKFEEVVDNPIQLSKQSDILIDNLDRESIDKGKSLHEVTRIIGKTLEQKILEMYNKNKE